LAPRAVVVPHGLLELNVNSLIPVDPGARGGSVLSVAPATGPVRTSVWSIDLQHSTIVFTRIARDFAPD
jgi:hypothetical protein